MRSMATKESTQEAKGQGKRDEQRKNTALEAPEPRNKIARMSRGSQEASRCSSNAGERNSRCGGCDCARTTESPSRADVAAEDEILMENRWVRGRLEQASRPCCCKAELMLLLVFAGF